MVDNAPDSALARVLQEAIIDEYTAIASYEAVIKAFGPVRPFVNIVEAERTHVNALLPLLERYGIPVPEDTWSTQLRTPASLLEACKIAVDAEKANVAMYDKLLSATQAPDVRAVLLRLQEASRDRHLPAFERCVARESGRGRRWTATACWWRSRTSWRLRTRSDLRHARPRPKGVNATSLSRNASDRDGDPCGKHQDTRGRGQQRRRPADHPERPRLEVHRPAVGVEDRLVHHLRQRRVREDGVHQVRFRRLQGARDSVALDQLGDFGAHHVRA
jgi:rubrerythrin